MTVEQLINELECFDPDTEVVMKPCNSMYVDTIGSVSTNQLRASWGNDRKVLVISGNSQIGAV